MRISINYVLEKRAQDEFVLTPTPLIFTILRGRTTISVDLAVLGRSGKIRPYIGEDIHNYLYSLTTMLGIEP